MKLRGMITSVFGSSVDLRKLKRSCFRSRGVSLETSEGRNRREFGQRRLLPFGNEDFVDD